MDRLHSMAAFAKVIDEGGFAAAARAMDVSASVVTRLVADLEEHLGARLIQRTTRRLSLTPAGRRFLEHVRAILQAVEDAEDALAAEVHSLHGDVRMAVPGAWAARQVAQRLPDFRRRYPRVTVDLAVASPSASPDPDCDLSLLLADAGVLDGDFVARPLMQSAGVLCAAPGYLHQRGTPTHPRELQLHDCLFDDRLTMVRLSGERDRFTIDTPAAAPVRARHTDAMVAAALEGLGVVRLPELALHDALHDGALVRVLPEWSAPAYQLYAAMPSRKHVPASTKAFMSFLVDAFRVDDAVVKPLFAMAQ
jgi:DNA-binding transcriptional LysR family regulator